MRSVWLLLPLGRCDPFALTASQRASLQAAAVRLELPPAGTCPGDDKEPTDIEKDFAANPYWKYFTYDTYDKDTWKTLDGLEQCLRSVKGNDDWVIGEDLWEAHKEIYRKLGESAAPSGWWRQIWIERRPLMNRETVLGTAKNETAPFSVMSDEAWEQQPCNAMSNAAYFEPALQACRSSLSDFGGTWNWRSEFISAASLMAFGSFAMHGNPSAGLYHEATGVEGPVQYPVNSSSQLMAYDTGVFDNLAMDVLFFLFFQVTVRSLARDPQEDLRDILGLIEDPRLEPLGCGSMYCDALLIAHEFQKGMALPADQWWRVHQLKDYVPKYTVASVGAILSDELFGSSAMAAYAQICSLLVTGLVPKPEEAEMAVQNFCSEGSKWTEAMKVTRFRQVKDIAKSLALLVTMLETLVEGFYWQESLVQPVGYLDSYLAKGVLNVSACWRQTHANWHWTAAQMMKELLNFLTVEVEEATSLDITAEQKQQAWGSLNLVVSEFIAFVNALKMMKVNLCRLLKLVKETAMSGNPPMTYQVMPLLDAAGLNEQLAGLLRQQDPIRDVDLNVNEKVKDPTGACNYWLKNVAIDEISGLSNLLLRDVSLTGQYVEGSSYENTEVQFDLGMKTCPLDLTVKASGEFLLNGGSLGMACRRTVWRLKATVDLSFEVESMKAWAKANFQKVFAADSGALSGGVDEVKLEIKSLRLSRFDITNFAGEEALQSAGAVSSMMSQAGSKLPFGDDPGTRRLAMCSSSTGNVAIDSAVGMWLSLPLMAFIYNL